jgi:lysophospholipase L1-like esterase
VTQDRRKRTIEGSIPHAGPDSSLVRRSLFTLFTSLTLFGALEAGLRLAGWPDPGLYEDASSPVWRLRPGLDREVPFELEASSFHVRTNTRGWRGEEPSPGALLCLGDSTTFGWGVAEDEAWPARLQQALGAPVTNGGVPGYSTFQALATLEQALESRPSRVLLGFLVRDAELAPMADADRPPAQALPELFLVRAIRQTKARSPTRSTATSSGVPRVPPRQYRANLDRLIARVEATGAEALVLAFPMQSPPQEHLAALEGLRVMAPELPTEAFFPNDPIHLTAQGNALLADWLAAELAEQRPRKSPPSEEDGPSMVLPRGFEPLLPP